jgi:hypothetical protein
MLLDLAVGAGAAYLISHDGDLTRMKAVGDCLILKPGRFYRDVMGLSDTPKQAPAPIPAPALARTQATSSKRKPWRPSHQVSPAKGFNAASNTADRAEARRARQADKHEMRRTAQAAMMARSGAKPGRG